ncbi:YckD family protein [Thermanaeromonas sp. C210]|uniref:YckD family protein n=1 Tax=Thermanaeromonas sp. C210 TaxID=2731925 RepID=UPI00155D232C|nr:YckD family protein [Thermanaeromonas sp. C210]GFN22104.1 hypothetical protein TAMC210_04200 [Thermanaeromonas sp. C210]
MKKKLVVVMATLLLVALAVPAAFAALNDQQREEVNQLFQQMFELKKQIIDKYVEGGEITPEQGRIMKEHLDYMQQYHRDYGFGIMGAGHCGAGFFGNNGGRPAPSGFRYGGHMMGAYGMMY